MPCNGYVYEMFGISESKPVKPLQFLLNVTVLRLALSAKCFIYFVSNWLFYFSVKTINKINKTFHLENDHVNGKIGESILL